MTVLFELLFRAWCPPYDPDKVPDYLRSDPVTAYGQYAFEKGFRLAAELLFLCLDPGELSKLG